MLLVELGRGVDAARLGRRVLADRGAARAAAPQRGQGGSKRPASRSAGARGAGRTSPWRRAQVAALAVDDHAAGEDQRAAEVGARQRREQPRGAEVVGGDVVGDLGEVEAEADHRRLVADRVDPLDRGRRDGGVGEVALDQLGGRVQVVGPARVGGRMEAVEDPDLAPLGDQQIDEV